MLLLRLDHKVWLFLLAIIMVVGLGIGPGHAGAYKNAKHRCEVPATLEQLIPPPVNTAHRLTHRAPVLVIAIGSSSTEGIGASSPAASYPARLQVQLRRHCLGCQITVINKGVAGETVDQTLARFDRDVFAYRPNLVIWQIGSNDVLQNETMESYFSSVTSGIRRLRAAGIEVVLMDMQFAPSLLVHPQVTIMESHMARLAQAEHVSLFRRFDIMENWILSGHFSFSNMLSRDTLHMTDASYDCLARLLSRALLWDGMKER